MENVKTMGKLTPENLSDEGCLRLACEICKRRSDNFRAAFRNYLKDPSPANLRDVKRWERKLKGPITGLDDDDISSLKLQVYKIYGRYPRRRNW